MRRLQPAATVRFRRVPAFTASLIKGRKSEPTQSRHSGPVIRSPGVSPQRPEQMLGRAFAVNAHLPLARRTSRRCDGTS
jgi:hypothetical protein